MTDAEGAGTTGQASADAAKLQTGAEAGNADRNGADAQVEEKTIAVPEREYASWKTKVERVNDLEEENRRLREAPQQTPTAGDAQSAEAQIAAVEAEARKFAAQGDPVASLLLAERAERLRREEAQRGQDERNTFLANQLKATPEDIRQKVYAEFMRGGYEDVNAARLKVQGDSFTARERELLERAAAAERKAGIVSVPGQGSRDGPSAPKDQEIMTEADWKHEQARLTAEGRDDERMQRQLLRRKGKIAVH